MVAADFLRHATGVHCRLATTYMARRPSEGAASTESGGQQRRTNFGHFGGIDRIAAAVGHECSGVSAKPHICRGESSSCGDCEIECSCQG